MRKLSKSTNIKKLTNRHIDFKEKTKKAIRLR